MTTKVKGTEGIEFPDSTVQSSAAYTKAESAQRMPVGTIIDFAGTVAPAGFLACPQVQTNISRATYAALFAVIGTKWGAGDGSTTFGMPYFPYGYPAVGSDPGSVGQVIPGAVQPHIHLISQPNGATSVGGVVYGNPGATGPTNSATGANMPAGVTVLKCVRYLP